MAKLNRGFFARPTLDVARDLLGKYLVMGSKVGKIVETEGYLGSEDLGSHARFGPTRRNQVMFGPPGHAYVYFTYGLHYLLNVTTEKDGLAGAVLIRAIEPISGIEQPTNGPARLTRALGINIAQNGQDLTRGPLRLEDRGETFEDVVQTTRVGIDYAGSYRDKPWRFYIKGNPFVSRS
jgi:DNA-3-methyladenine glycosylase